MSSGLLTIGIAGAGLFTLVLGVIHVRIPAILRYAEAIGPDKGHAPIGRIRFRLFAYGLRRTDLVGVTWVMSNAASYVLLTVGVVDLLWAAGWGGVPIAIGGVWIAGWWAIRAGGQLVVGRRGGDVAVAAWFACLALLHLVLALNRLGS